MVLAGLFAAATLAVVVVQASASGTEASKLAAVARLAAVPKRLSLKHAAAAVQASLRSEAGPQASAIVGDSPATVSCGQTLTASTTLTADLNCAGDNGLMLGANGIVLNLNGHFIIGSNNQEDGTVGVWDRSSAKDTIENGYIVGFEYGVVASGATDAITNVQATGSRTLGFILLGNGDKATSDTAAENFRIGMALEANSDTAQSDHLLNNEGIGLAVEETSGDKLLDNVANGNTGDGIVAEGTIQTLTGNTANYNDELGIDAISPQIDGGSNTAMGNGTKEQCRGVVCS